MHFLITAGGTREYIDPVRFISNASSGKMGYALAGAAIKTGHKVTLITAPTALQPPADAKIIDVQTAKEMFGAVRRHFKKCDCLIMAAAVSDYAPVKKSKIKIKKANKNLVIKLRPTVDILKWAGKNKKKNQVVIGFALEDKNLKATAEKKLKDKNLDIIIANTPKAIGSSLTQIHHKTANGKWGKSPLVSKQLLANELIKAIEKLY